MPDLVTVPSALLDRLRALGIDVPVLLQEARLIPSRFGTPRARLTVAEFFAFWNAMAMAGATRERILRLGAEAKPHQLDMASMAAMHSASFGAGMEKFARYKRIVCAEEVDVDRVDGEARIGFHWVNRANDPPSVLPMFLVDVSFASILALARTGLESQRIVPLRVELARRRHDATLLERHFGCPVRFDAPLDALVFDEALLARPFVTHNPDLLAILVPALETTLRTEHGTRSLIADVKTALQRRMSGERPSVEKIASELHLGSRTLQRRLGELGTSYQQLLDDVRHTAARRLLVDTDLDAGEVAFLLGFEELSSFTRAFHGWEGLTPSRWREGAHASA